MRASIRVARGSLHRVPPPSAARPFRRRSGSPTLRRVEAATAQAAAGGPTLRGTRLVAGYAVLAALVAAAAIVSISLGHDEHAAPDIAGAYSSRDACLGPSFDLKQAGQFVDLAGGVSGKLRFRDRRLTGDVTCAGGGAAAAALRVRDHTLSGTVGGRHATARYEHALPASGSTAQPAKKRTSEETFGRLMLAIAAVILAARLVGAAMAKL